MSWEYASFHHQPIIFRCILAEVTQSKQYNCEHVYVFLVFSVPRELGSTLARARHSIDKFIIIPIDLSLSGLYNVT